MLMLNKEVISGVLADGVFINIKSFFEFRRSLCLGRLFFYLKKRKKGFANRHSHICQRECKLY